MTDRILHTYYRHLCQSGPQYWPGYLKGGRALSQLWLFIVAPFTGVMLSAFIWKIIGSPEKKELADRHTSLE